MLKKAPFGKEENVFMQGFLKEMLLQWGEKELDKQWQTDKQKRLDLRFSKAMSFIRSKKCKMLKWRSLNCWS